MSLLPSFQPSAEDEENYMELTMRAARKLVDQADDMQRTVPKHSTAPPSEPDTGGETDNLDAEEARAYMARKAEFGDDPRFVLAETILTLMDLQNQISELHLRAADELRKLLLRLIALMRRRGSRNVEKEGEEDKAQEK